MLISSPLFLGTAQAIGFRNGTEGSHTSRTIMFDDIRALLGSTPVDATKAHYRAAIIEDNCLAKSTTANRRSSAQRLSEIYALDPGVKLFRVFRNMWFTESDDAGLRQLAILTAVARDPLLAATVSTVITLVIDQQLTRSAMAAALRASVGDRLNASILDKVARNAGSSWTQSGHLAGRTFKRRQRINATPSAAAFAIYLAYHAGFRGTELFGSLWVRILDLSPADAKELALDAKRRGIFDLRIAGDVVSPDFSRMEK